MTRMSLTFVCLCTLLWPASQRVALAATPPLSVTYQFADDVSEEDRAYIREGIRLAHDFFLETFGVTVERSVTVEAASTIPGAPASAQAIDHLIRFQTGHPVWLTSSPFHRTKISVHEYFHVLQAELTNLRFPGPAWLHEGSAEYAAFRAVGERGLADPLVIRDYLLEAVVYGEPMPPLADLADPEVFYGICCPIMLAPLSVDSLVARSDAAALVEYFELLGKDTPWEQAFEEAFELTAADFFAMFEAERQGFWPSSSPAGLHYPAYFVDGIGEVSFLSVTTPVPRGSQAVLSAVTVPGVKCTLVFTSASGNHLLTQETRADALGNVFWLWSVRNRLARGTATAQVNCGSAPVTANIELT